MARPGKLMTDGSSLGRRVVVVVVVGVVVVVAGIGEICSVGVVDEIVTVVEIPLLSLVVVATEFPSCTFAPSVGLFPFEEFHKKPSIANFTTIKAACPRDFLSNTAWTGPDKKKDNRQLFKVMWLFLVFSLKLPSHSNLSEVYY